MNLGRTPLSLRHDRFFLSSFSGPTPFHLAARCGALDVVSCLVACGASMLLVDKDGWAPIHLAAFYDHSRIVSLMVRKNDALLELQTKNE